MFPGTTKGDLLGVKWSCATREMEARAGVELAMKFSVLFWCYFSDGIGAYGHEWSRNTEEALGELKPLIRNVLLVLKWHAQKDSNLRPTD